MWQAALFVGVLAVLPLSRGMAADAATQPTVFGFQGEQLPKQRMPKQRKTNPDLVSPPASFFLSLIVLPGAGQYYNGSVVPYQHLKGGLFTSAHVVSTIMMTSGALSCLSSCTTTANALQWTGIGVQLSTRLWSAIDALVVARKINSRKYDLQQVNDRKKFKYLYRRVSAVPALVPSEKNHMNLSRDAVGVELTYAF